MHKTVFIVEDDESILEAMRDSLEFKGYKVAVASNGKEALDTLEKMENPCLIFLDLMMPVMDGYQFRQHQTRNAKIADIPVVVVTADGNARQKAASMGAIEGIKKPLQFEELLKVTRRFCG